VSDPGELSREELLAALAERDAVIAALLAEIEQLKRRVEMDSSNSSMPPGVGRSAGTGQTRQEAREALASSARRPAGSRGARAGLAR
jgi:hypothetical protein